MTWFFHLQSAVRADTVQTLMDVILRSDMDMNSSFSEKEINVLYLRLKNLPGVKVNHDALQRSLGEKSHTLTNVFSLVQDMDMEQSDVPEEERVFQFEEV